MVDFHKGLEGFENLGKKKKAGEPEPLSLISKNADEKLSKPVSDMQKTGLFYGEVLYFVRENLDLVAQGKEDKIDPEAFKKTSDEITDRILKEIVPDDLVRIAFQRDEYKDNYVYDHSVNVCFLSAYVALRLNFTKAKLKDLVMASLFHDIGLMRIPVGVWNKDGRLSQSDYEQVKRHTGYGKDIFEKLYGPDSQVAQIVGQYHETVDGTGYPGHLKKGAINYIARLLGPIDRYEAQTHSRLWKPRALPDMAMQQMLDHDSGKYDIYFMKAILKYISIFPVGSWARLSSGEYGKVMKVNEDTPMRPVLEVDFDREKKPLSEVRMLDLSRQLLIHVQNCVDPEELGIKEK